MEQERAVERLAARQYGVVSRQQVLAAGMTARMIDGRLRVGRWQAPRPGVYAMAGSPPTWEQAVLAACMAGGPAAFTSHGTALRLWGLSDRFDRTAIHLVSPPGRRIRLDGVVSHRSSVLSPLDLHVVRGIPTTSTARAIIEISGKSGVSATGKLVDQAIRGDRGQLEAVRACAARLVGPGRRRLDVIREVLALRLPGYDADDSDLEVRALRALHLAGLHLPVQQHPVVAGGRRRRIDLAYPHLMIAIELDGWDAHGVRSAFDDDRARGNELVILGWQVVHLTSRMTDEEMVDAVRRLLARVAA